jgi:uncharacterized membrane protein
MLKTLNSNWAILLIAVVAYVAIALSAHYGMHIPYEYEAGLVCIGIAGYALLDWAVAAIVKVFKKNG